jgi:hypothetical protein
MKRQGFIILALIAACGLAPGCRRDGPVTEERLGRLHTTWDDAPLRIQQQPVAVKQGPAPLVHVFDLGASIRVVNLTTGAQLAAATIEPRTLVRVDVRNGVIAGKATIAPGPLNADHKYAIYADPTTDNVIRHGVGPPGSSRQQD